LAVMREIRSVLSESLKSGETILPHGLQEVLVVLPGVARDALPQRVIRLREAFCRWRESREESRIRLSLGYASCEGGKDLTQTLEVAAHLMHSESDDELWATA
jgi:GGDEF domain-containing protein